MLQVDFTVCLGLPIYFVLLSRTLFFGRLGGVAIDAIVHMCDDNQWILNQTPDPLEGECVHGNSSNNNN